MERASPLLKPPFPMKKELGGQREACAKNGDPWGSGIPSVSMSSSAFESRCLLNGGRGQRLPSNRRRPFYSITEIFASIGKSNPLIRKSSSRGQRAAPQFAGRRQRMPGPWAIGGTRFIPCAMPEHRIDTVLNQLTPFIGYIQKHVEEFWQINNINGIDRPIIYSN